MTVEQLAAWLNAPYEGQGHLEVTDVADLSNAQARHVSFAYGAKGLTKAEESAAGCLLVPHDFELAGRTVIRVPDPRAAFARVVFRFHPPKRPAPGIIHPTAVVSPDARLDPSVSVGPYSVIGGGVRIGAGTAIGTGCHIGDGVSIGDDGLLHDNVTIYHGVAVGSHAIIHSGAVIGADGFGFVLVEDHYEKFPQVGRVVIGDHVEVGANTCIDRAALGETVLGNGVKLDNLVHIAHNVRLGDHVVIAAQTGISGGAVIGDYVVMGGQVGLGEKARVEDKAVIGGQCGVLSTRPVRSGETVWGTPARPIKQHLVQLAELSRIGKLREEITDLKQRLSRLEQE